MAKVGRNGRRLEKGRWLKAPRLAKLLFEDEGYFSDYLEEIESFVEDHSFGISRGKAGFYIKAEKSLVLSIVNELKIPILIDDLRAMISRC